MVKKRCLCKMGGTNMEDDETLKRQKLINKAKEMYSKGCKYKDISQEIGIPESTIKSWRRRKQWSKKRLRLMNKRFQTLHLVQMKLLMIGGNSFAYVILRPITQRKLIWMSTMLSTIQQALMDLGY